MLLAHSKLRSPRPSLSPWGPDAAAAAQMQIRRSIFTTLGDCGCDRPPMIGYSGILCSTLVLKANLDILLRGRNDMVLGRALEVRKFCHSLLDDLKGLLNLLLRDNQGRGKTNDVLVGGFGLENASQ
jgi:hypothetical protein